MREPRRRGLWLAAAGVVGVALVALALRVGPAVVLSLSLALPVTEAWFSPILPAPSYMSTSKRGSWSNREVGQ